MTMKTIDQNIISVVIPVYNRENVIGKTLDSIANQVNKDFNLILVDNASTDNSMQVLLDWKKHMELSHPIFGQNIVIASCNKPGAAAARNVGLNMVDTPWVMFFDSDDIMGEKHVDTALKDILQHPSADIIGWNTKITDTTGKLIKTTRFKTSSTQWHNLFNGLLSTQRYCVKTALMRKAGGWNESVFYWIDIELGARILALKPSIIKSRHNDNRVIVIRNRNSITGTPDTDPIRIEPALNSISEVLGPEYRNRILLKKIIEAALCSKAGSEKGTTLYRKTIEEASSIPAKMMLTMAYMYTKAGGRGIALIYKNMGL